MRGLAVLTGVLGGIFFFLVYASFNMTTPNLKPQHTAQGKIDAGRASPTTVLSTPPKPQEVKTVSTAEGVEGVHSYCDLVQTIHGTSASGAFGRNLVPALRILSESLKPLKFVQIGAHVGGVNQSHDDTMSLVQQYGWHGILVEPSPPLFTELKKKYGDWNNLYFEQVGVSNKNATMTFYAVNSTIDPYTGKTSVEGERNRLWFATQLGTFDVSRAKGIMRSLPMTEVPVDVVDFSGLIARHPDMEKLHYLLIDTEGFDYKVLSGVDFFRFRPFVVVYEHNKLSGANKRAAVDRLKRAGYDTTEQDHQNTMAFRGCTPEERQHMLAHNNVPELLRTLQKASRR